MVIQARLKKLSGTLEKTNPALQKIMLLLVLPLFHLGSQPSSKRLFEIFRELRFGICCIAFSALRFRFSVKRPRRLKRTPLMPLFHRNSRVLSRLLEIFSGIYAKMRRKALPTFRLPSYAKRPKRAKRTRLLPFLYRSSWASSRKLLKIVRRIHIRMRRRVPFAFRSRSSAKRPRKAKLTLTMVALLLMSVTASSFVTAQVLSSVQAGKTVSSKGSIGMLQTVGVEVYTDSTLTSEVTTISWGVLSPGTQRNFSMYVHNEGSTPITLSHSVSNWNPSNAAAYMTLKWNYSGQTLGAGQGLQVTLTLTVSSGISGIDNFSFDITVVGAS
jgi:hypothetical protein